MSNLSSQVTTPDNMINNREFRPQFSHPKESFNEKHYEAVLKAKGFDQEQIELALRIRKEIKGKYLNLI